MIIRGLKKTLGKDKRYYYYEGLSSECTDVNLIDKTKISWYRIDKEYYSFLYDKYHEASLLSYKNNDNEIIEFYYKEHVEDKSLFQKIKEASEKGEIEKFKIRPGCLKNFILTFFLVLILYNAIKQ